MKRNLAALCGLAALLSCIGSGCTTDIPSSPELSQLAGDRIFTRYVAVGHAMTAGFMDGGLHFRGQLGCYPALIARRMGYQVNLETTDDFFQPYVDHPGIGITDVGPAVVAGVLYWNGSELGVAGTTPAADVQVLLLTSTVPRPYNNLGVPFSTALDLDNATGSGNSQQPDNSFFDFILRNPNLGNTTVLRQAVGRGPTLVTVWVGYSEILGGMLTGSPLVDVAGNITPPIIFAGLLGNFLDELESDVIEKTGFKPTVVIANLPGDYPYFLPVALFEALAGGTIPFVEDPVERVLFTALGFLQGGGTPPLPATLTLSDTEWQLIQDTIDGYNQAISDAAAGPGRALVDIHALVDALSTTGVDGFTGGLPLPDPVQSSSAYSLDGIHFNNHGQGLLANAFLEVINQTAGTDLDPISLDTVSWDPTYGLPQVPPARTAAGDASSLPPSAADALAEHYR